MLSLKIVIGITSLLIKNKDFLLTIKARKIIKRATWVVEAKYMKADTKVKQANREEDQHIIPFVASSH